MTKQQKKVTYFSGEGRLFMQDCLQLSFEYSIDNHIGKIIIFTGSGEGPLYALQSLLPKPEYNHLKVIAITPPFGRPYKNSPQGDFVKAGIGEPIRHFLNNSGIPVISAHLPFNGIQIGPERVSEWSRVGEAFGIMGGGFSLCLQSVLIATDAGFVDVGETVVVATADTALAAIATRTENFLSPVDGLIVEHIIARPAIYNISKANHRKWFTPPPPPPPPLLPPPSSPLLPPPLQPPSSRPKKAKKSV